MRRKSLQSYQVDMFLILEGVEKLRDPRTAVQTQDPPLLLVKNHLSRVKKAISIKAIALLHKYVVLRSVLIT